MTTGEQGGSWNPIQPTSELAALALGKLMEGDLDKDFRDIAGHLQNCVGESEAMSEGTLLFAGATLYEGVQAIKAQRERDAAIQGDQDNPAHDGHEPTIRNPLNMKTMFAYLDWVQMGAARRGMRPVGQSILDHCQELAQYDEAMAEVAGKLTLIKGLAQAASSSN